MFRYLRSTISSESRGRKLKVGHFFDNSQITGEPEVIGSSLGLVTRLYRLIGQFLGDRQTGYPIRLYTEYRAGEARVAASPPPILSDGR
jgi:hypothetical protein